MHMYKFLGVKFLDGSFEEIVGSLDSGGLMVVPAAPALAMIEDNPLYYRALKDSDFAIFDSGLLCIMLGLAKGIRAKKMSGLEFLRRFLSAESLVDKTQVFLVNPSSKAQILNKALFEEYGFEIGENHYTAPIYPLNKIIDEKLLSMIQAKKPKYIVINLGGGVQEILGAYLKKNLDESYRPAIVCTGAAIAFLTGSQSKIPKVVDDMYLGWLARCLANPKVFVVRYISGLKLIRILLSNKVERLV